MGILLAIPIIILKQHNISLPLISEMPLEDWLGTILLLAVMYWLYRTARGRATR